MLITVIYKIYILVSNQKMEPYLLFIILSDTCTNKEKVNCIKYLTNSNSRMKVILKILYHFICCAISCWESSCYRVYESWSKHSLWGMKLNEGKTRTMIVSRSRTVHPQLTQLTLDGTVLKESADLVILGVTFDAKMAFEEHLCSVSSVTASRLVIMRKSWQVFHDRSLFLRSFWSFVLSVLEHSSAVWSSAVNSHLKQLGRVIRGPVFLLVLFWSATLPNVDLWQRCACYLRLTQCILWAV